MKWLSKLWRRPGDLGDLDPDDPAAFWRLSHQLGRALDDKEGQVDRLLRQHGVRDWEHWRRIVMRMGARHGDSEAFRRAALQTRNDG